MRRVLTEEGTVAEKPWGWACVSNFDIGRAGENGWKFHSFCKEWIAKLLPENLARTEFLFEEYLLDETSLLQLSPEGEVNSSGYITARSEAVHRPEGR